MSRGNTGAVPSSDAQSLTLPSSNNSFSLKARLKRFPFLVRLNKAIRGALYGFDSEILDRLPLFQPWSAGPSEGLEKLTVLAANQTFPFLAQLLTTIGRDSLPIIGADDFCEGSEARGRSAQLKQLFDRHGSDKSREHDYHFVYGRVLGQPESVTAILEIGLGSHNDDIVSNMGRQGKPGASLRAFREFLPNAQIYGADVDKRILFQEDRIRTYFVDQTNLESFDALGRNVAASFDMIIDDGLHSPNANIAVLIFGLSRLKIGGWLIVEDIHKSAVPVWKVVGALLPPELKPYILEAKNGAIVFAVQKTA